MRCRAIILHEGKLLVVKHSLAANFVALPGGHLESGEGIQECLEREIMEELGVKPEIGRLLYVNRFIGENDVESVEFFFEVTNGTEYVESDKLARSHAHELVDIIWVSAVDDFNLLPSQVAEDFRTRKIISDEIRYLKP